MTLLSGSKLRELRLRDPRDEPIQASKYLGHVLSIQDLPLGLPDEGLDAGQAVADEVGAEALVDLVEHGGAELVRVADGDAVKDLVDEARLQQLVAADAPAHDEGLIGLADAEALHQGARRAALGDQAQRGEGRQQEGRGHAVDEVGEGHQGRREADDGPVEADDQDLGVRVEGLRRVEVVGDEAAQPQLVGVVGGAIFGLGARDGYISATFGGFIVLVSFIIIAKVWIHE